MSEIRTLMGISVSWGKMGFVYLEDGELLDWGTSIDATRSREAAGTQALKWMRYYGPQMLVLEQLDEASRKGDVTKTLVGAVERAADEAGVAHTALPRSGNHPNKYAEATALAEEFPQIAPWLPKPRRLWEPEPHNIILFEALSLATGWWRTVGTKGLETIDW